MRKSWRMSSASEYAPLYCSARSSGCCSAWSLFKFLPWPSSSLNPRWLKLDVGLCPCSSRRELDHFFHVPDHRGAETLSAGLTIRCSVRRCFPPSYLICSVFVVFGSSLSFDRSKAVTKVPSNPRLDSARHGFEQGVRPFAYEVVELCVVGPPILCAIVRNKPWLLPDPYRPPVGRSRYCASRRPLEVTLSASYGHTISCWGRDARDQRVS